MTFWKVSRRLLPVASGIATVRESRTLTNPAGPPRGETSQFPSASALEIRTSEEQAINRRVWSVSSVICLRTAAALGSS